MPENPVEQAPSHATQWILVVIGIGIALAIIMGSVYFYAMSRLSEQSARALAEAPIVKPIGATAPRVGSVAADVAEVMNSNASGDYRTALNAYQEVVTSEIATPNAKASATFNIASAAFRDTGNIEDYIDNLEDMKAAVRDDRVSPLVKVTLLNMIASSYCRSGRTSEVFNRIYSGPLFEDFLVPKNPDLSSNHLYEYGYKLHPTSKAAVRIARWYSEEALYKWKNERALATQHLETAEKLLQEADVLNAEEETRFDGLENSTQDVSYWLWRAYDRGILARLKPVPYAAEYKEAYRIFFERAAQTVHVGSKQQIPFAHVFYARALQKIDNDEAAAKAELIKAVQHAKNDPNPKASEFTIFIRNEYPRTSPISVMLHELADISPEFKAFAESVV